MIQRVPAGKEKISTSENKDACLQLRKKFHNWETWWLHLVGVLKVGYQILLTCVLKAEKSVRNRRDDMDCTE